MTTILAILVGAAALGLFIWLLIPSSLPSPQADAESIDPPDSLQLGFLIGLTDGSIADAAVARFALQRFEEIYGRKATTKDLGIVIGLMSGGNGTT